MPWVLVIGLLVWGIYYYNSNSPHLGVVKMDPSRQLQRNNALCNNKTLHPRSNCQKNSSAPGWHPMVSPCTHTIFGRRHQEFCFRPSQINLLEVPKPKLVLLSAEYVDGGSEIVEEVLEFDFLLKGC